MGTVILRCPRCLKHWHWNQDDGPPGTCICGSFQYWRVLKKEPEPGFALRLEADGTWSDAFTGEKVVHPSQMCKVGE